MKGQQGFHADLCSVSRSALLLNSVMSAFRAEFIAARSMDFIGMIKECDESGFPKVTFLYPICNSSCSLSGRVLYTLSHLCNLRII